MTIRVTCSGCGSTLKIKDELAGKDGTCPKCKAAIHIPKADVAAGASNVEPQSESDADEDDMFGKDFFKVSEPSSRPKYTTPNYDEEEVAEKPKSKAGKKPSPEKNESQKESASAPAASADTAANMAGQLLSKTGKKNRSADWDEQNPEDSKTDYTELKYLLTRKVLPLGAGAIVAVAVVYLAMSSMLSDKPTRPELGLVHGICTIDGKPVGGADIRFYPKSKNPTEPAIGQFSIAISNADGSYVLRYDSETEGAVVGKHTVEVSYQGRIMLSQEQEVASGKNEKPLTFK